MQVMNIKNRLFTVLLLVGFSLVSGCWQRSEAPSTPAVSLGELHLPLPLRDMPLDPPNLAVALGRIRVTPNASSPITDQDRENLASFVMQTAALVDVSTEGDAFLPPSVQVWAVLKANFPETVEWIDSANDKPISLKKFAQFLRTTPLHLRRR